MLGARRTFWARTGSTAAALTNTEMLAAPGAGKAIYITDIHLSNEGGAANQISVLDGSGGAAMFNHYFAANQGITASFRTPMVLTANTALCVTTTAADHAIIEVGGYVEAV